MMLLLKKAYRYALVQSSSSLSQESISPDIETLDKVANTYGHQTDR